MRICARWDTNTTFPPRPCWNNTNLVVSNRVVSKGPLYPSKAKILIVVCWVTNPGTKPLPIHISGAGFAPNSQIRLLGTTPFDTTPSRFLRVACAVVAFRGAVLSLAPGCLRRCVSQHPVKSDRKRNSLPLDFTSPARKSNHPRRDPDVTRSHVNLPLMRLMPSSPF